MRDEMSAANKTVTMTAADIGGSSTTTTTTKPNETNTTTTTTSSAVTQNSIDFDENDEEDDLDESGSSQQINNHLKSNKEQQVADSNEAQENVQSSVVVEPESAPTTESQDLSAAAPEGDVQSAASGREVNQVEGNAVESADDADQLSRRVFSRNKLTSGSIGGERLRKLKGNKLFGKQSALKKRKRNKKAKNTQTRQGTTTAGYGHLASNYAATNSPLTFPSSLRHNFPQQLSATVQKLLLMNKLNPQVAASRPANKYQPAPQHHHQQQHNHLLADNAAQSLQHLLAKNHNQVSAAYQQHLANNGGGANFGPNSLNNPPLADLLNQWASSEDSPAYANSGGRPAAQRNKMIPVEIIGLDPAVTNSILYGASANESPVGAASVNSQAEPSGQLYQGGVASPGGADDEPDGSGGANALYQAQLLGANRGLRAAHAKSLDGGTRPKASSILHIHHFHTQVKPGGAAVAATSAEAAARPTVDEQRESAQQVVESGAGSAASGQQVSQDNLVHMVHAQMVPGGAQAHSAVKNEHQQVYVNDKGQLVYLSVEDAGAAAGGGESRPGSADHEQQQQHPDGGHKPEGETQEVSWPQVDTGSIGAEQSTAQDYPTAVTVTEAPPADQSQQQLAEPQSQDQQTGVADHYQQQEQQQVVALNSTYGQILVPQRGGSEAAKHQRAVYLTATGGGAGGLRGGQQIATGGDNEAAGDGRSQQPMLMVAYRPRPQLFRNLTEDSLSSTSHRTPYNEGQESKPALATHFMGSGSQPNSLFKGTSGLLLRPFAADDFPNADLSPSSRFRHNITELGGRLNNNQMVAGLTQLAQLHNEQSMRANFSNPFLPLQIPARYQVQDNRVPSPALSPFFNPALKALLSAEAFGGLAGNLSGSSGSTITNIPNSWLAPLVDDKFPQVNPHALGNSNRYPPIVQQNSTGQVNASATLFRHLQQFKDKLLQQVAAVPGRTTNNNLQQQAANSSTKISGDELLSMLNELARSNSTLNSNRNNHHAPEQPFNITFSDSSIAVPSISTRPSPSLIKPIKAIATQQSVQPNKPTNSNKSANGFPPRPPVAPLRPTEWPSAPPTPQIKRPPVAQDPQDYDDASGLSNIALAFIFIVSLLTLTVIAASMIYKQKRRSVGRCSELPARSARRLTRNLTKRTKHFTRSNFMNPGDISSIKSINLDSASLSTATKSPVSSGGAAGGRLEDSRSNPISETNRSSAGYITKKAFGQTLTTFNGTPLSEKYQFTTTTTSEGSTGDIKTLNTRLAKPSYLKSLISTPDCLLLGGAKQKQKQQQQQQQQQQVHQRADSASDGTSYYLNTRQVSGNGNLRGNQQQQQTAIKQLNKHSRSPSEEHCALSNHSKKLTCESPKAYGSSKESSLAAFERHQASFDNKHLPGGGGSGSRNKSIMSTIHSLGECEAKSAAELKKQQQHQQPVQLGAKWNKLPAPKHLAASLAAQGLTCLDSGRQLVVHNAPLSAGVETAVESSKEHDDDGATNRSANRNNLLSETTNSPVYYIAFKDVIKSISVRNIQQPGGSLADSGAGDLLLVGCSNGVLIYDALNQNNLQTIHTQTPVIAFANEPHAHLTGEPNASQVPTICAGAQRLFALKLGFSLSAADRQVEVSSERSVGETITCLASGHLNGLDLVLTGSEEKHIRVYQLDTFDQNIQACRLTIEEHSQVSCLCAINTISSPEEEPVSDTNEPSNLPSVSAVKDSQQVDSVEQTNCFAYGLESGYVGVYRLLTQPMRSSTTSLTCERLWGHRCRSAPLRLLLFDLNGDGLDELIVAFRSGRVEVRSPFTGQLLAATRCFKQSERLVSVMVVDYYLDGRPMLVACSSLGSLIGFRPRASRPRVALQTYANGQTHLTDLDSYPSGEFAVGGSLLLSHLNANGDLKTIEEEQQLKQSGDVFMKEDEMSSADLHIESASDDIKTSKCDARQSFELLHRIGSLHDQQVELARRVSHIYHRNLDQASQIYLPDVTIAHQWDFDATILHLRLTIVVSSRLESVRLMELEDESRSYLASGYQLVSPGAVCGDSKSSQSNVKSQVVVVPLRSSRDLATKLCIKVYCDSMFKSSNNNSNKCATQVYRKLINVPRYTMFTLVARDQIAEDGENGSRVKIMAQLRDNSQVSEILRWLADNFLCFQFGKLSSELPDGASVSSSSASSALIKHQHLYLSDDFRQLELYLRDVRHTPVTAAAENNPSVKVDTDDEPLVGCKFANKCDSTLRVTCCNGALQLECENSDLAADLVQSLMIDRLHLQQRRRQVKSADNKPLEREEFRIDVGPILSELDTLKLQLRQLEDSEKRIQSELYEAADYTKALMDQLAIANELNEFSLAKELLNELFMMLTEAQNAARTHCLNNRQPELRRRLDWCREKVTCFSSSSSANQSSKT